MPIQRRKLLLLSSRAPVPPNAGERLKNLNLLRILSRHFDVHLLTMNERALTSGERAELAAMTKSLQIFVKPSWRSALQCLRSLWNGLPLQINYFYFSDVQGAVDKLVPECDVLVCTLVRTAQYVRHAEKPKFMDMADSIASNYREALAKTSSWWWRLIYGFEVRRLEKYEHSVVGAFNATFLFNQDEVKTLSEQSPQAKVVWVPHGVNEKLLTYAHTEPGHTNEICFLGKMDYRPNIEACIWFIRQVLPLLPATLKFVILGAKPAREVLQLAQGSPQVEVTGFVDDPYLRMKSSLCVVAPMVTGAGIQNKVLEAMALGQIVVATRRCVTPLIGVREGEEILVEDDPKKMASLILSLQQLPDTERERLGYQARQYVASHFTWAAFERVWMDTLTFGK